MTSKLTKAAIAVLMTGTAFASPAAAQSFFGSSPAEDSFYVSGFVGAVFPSNGNFDGTQTPDPAIPATVGGSVADAVADVALDFDTDIYFGGAIGYQLPFQFYNTFHPRLEVEVSYLETDISDGSFNDGNQVFSGDQTSLFIFVNNFTDIRWADNQVIVPYIGGGFGVGIIDTNAFYFAPTAAFAPAPAFGVIGEDTGFATHTTIGVTFAANDSFEIYTEGRYLKTYGIDAERRFLGGGTVDLFNAEVDDAPEGFTISGGVRLRF